MVKALELVVLAAKFPNPVGVGRRVRQDDVIVGRRAVGVVVRQAEVKKLDGNFLTEKRFDVDQSQIRVVS
jgi:hypothetical protein